MKFLISTETDDAHAAAVTLGLTKRGHQVAVYHGADFPTQQTASIRFNGAGKLRSVVTRDKHALLDMRSADVVWNRRHHYFELSTELHPADVEFARRETGHFCQGLWHMTAPTAFWVNPELASLRASRKPLQLEAASQSGLKVPETLFSNDPEDIRSFVRSARDGAIFKSSTAKNWSSAKKFASNITTQVIESQLPLDEVLQYVPGIFQALVPKAYEVRVTLMGCSYFAVALHSQECSEAQIDWRWAEVHGKEIRMEKVELPGDVVEGCVETMKRLGIVFGCIDLIVTPTNDVVFLEVNEMGQFLWIEDRCPSLPLLDAFIGFLEHGSADFVYKRSANPIQMVDLRKSGALLNFVSHEATLHRTPSDRTTTQE